MTLRVLLAGMAGGYAMALATTAVGTYLLVLGMRSGRLERWIDRGVPTALISVQILIASTALWMLLGTALAALYLAGDFADMSGAIGSPSLPFTGIVLALAVAPIPLAFVVDARRWWLWAALGLVFAVVFGWILPLAGE